MYSQQRLGRTLVFKFRCSACGVSGLTGPSRLESKLVLAIAATRLEAIGLIKQLFLGGFQEKRCRTWWKCVNRRCSPANALGICVVEQLRAANEHVNLVEERVRIERGPAVV